jgi:L-aspartate oxidase
MIYDYLIIGSGIAGLNATRYIPKDKKVIVVCKKSPWECNTFYAQGGVATARDEEDIPLHIKDTIDAGVGLNNRTSVELMSKISLSSINDLIDSGFEFDKNDKGELAFTKEAAHSKSRILHADGDATGRILHSFLLGSCPFEISEDTIVLDLILEDNICKGAVCIKNSEQKIIKAKNTIIASGGIGSIYKYHTNATTISGELQGICLSHNIELENMEMMQFHPTVFTNTSFARKTLLTEALRGEGAYIVDSNGKRFLYDYHKEAELAPRDVVSQAIFDYHKKSGLEVFLSFDTMSKKFFKSRFPNIYRNLKDFGYDLPFEQVPISPAFHYAMGGIKTGLDARVVGYKNLFAIGEVASTGVHGANRLASNSLLEGLVFSKIAIKNSLEADEIDINFDHIKTSNFITHKQNDKKIKGSLRQLMWDNVGIVRTDEELNDALRIVKDYLKNSDEIGRLLYLRLLTAKSIIEASIKRKESLGAHCKKEE